MFLGMDEIRTLTGLEEPDIRFLCSFVVCRPETAIRKRDLLPLLVFDILKKMGYTDRHCTTIVHHFRGQLLHAGMEYDEAKVGDKFVMKTLNVLDNRYATISTEPKNVFDFKKSERVQQLPMPTVSLALALPKLFGRALEAVPALPCPRSEVEGPQASESD